MSALADPLAAPLPRPPVPPKIVYGRRGKLPDDAPRACCACGKLIIRGTMPPGSVIEGYCRECKTHVVFET